MLTLTDLKGFFVLLNDNNCDIIKKLCILKKLENWDPIKDYIVISNIGKAVYKCSKSTGELGKRASIIVNKWKNLILSSSNAHNEFNKTIKNEDYDNKKLTNISRKSQNINVPNKKVCLSLTDYYKRKGIPIDNGDSENLQDIGDSLSSHEESADLTSDLGISFMDSFSIKPAKSKNSKLLKRSEIFAMQSADNISKRTDIVRNHILCEEINNGEDNVTSRVVSTLKYWTPKAREYHFIGGDNQPSSLLKLCQDVLLVNRLYIEEVLWTPRELLLTVLENYTPDQLFNFESFNPHFIEDNDELWQKHYLAKFSNLRKSSKETWRQAYERAVLYQSTKFDMSVQNMKKKILAVQQNEKKHSVKVINTSYRNPEKRRFFDRNETDSCYSKVTQKLRKQYRKQFSHLRF